MFKPHLGDLTYFKPDEPHPETGQSLLAARIAAVNSDGTCNLNVIDVDGTSFGVEGVLAVSATDDAPAHCRRPSEEDKSEKAQQEEKPQTQGEEGA